MKVVDEQLKTIKATVKGLKTLMGKEEKNVPVTNQWDAPEDQS
jgi:hypothetical protein